jgi:Flp pilus assembly protein TadB
VNLALLIASISAACALITLAYNIFLAPSRADRKELEKRLAKLELDDANHEARLTGFSQNMERQNDRWEERCKRIEQELSGVGRMREELATIKAVQNAQSENIKEIKDTMNRIFNLLQPSKN